jgi:hypothetical protein
MKAQAVPIRTTTLGPFLRLVLTLPAPDKAMTLEKLQCRVAEVRDLSAAAASEHQVSEATSRVSTRAMTLGPFLTLLLTLHHPSSWTDRDWWQGSKAPRGAVLAAHYVSR